MVTLSRYSLLSCGLLCLVWVFLFLGFFFVVLFLFGWVFYFLWVAKRVLELLARYLQYKARFTKIRL